MSSGKSLEAWLRSLNANERFALYHEWVHLACYISDDNFLPPDELRVLHRGQVLKKLGVSRQTLWKNIEAGNFSRPRDFLGRDGWLNRVVTKWIETRPEKPPARGELGQREQKLIDWAKKKGSDE